MEKFCTQCKTSLPLENFANNKNSKSSKNYYCKMCDNIRSREYFRNNRELKRAYQAKYREKNREKIRETCRGKYEQSYIQQVKSKYGISAEDYYNILDHQRDSCLVCLKLFTYDSKSNKPHIDHDHKTGKVRGILCNHCNAALGQARDSIPILKNMIKYIEDIN